MSPSEVSTTELRLPPPRELLFTLVLGAVVRCADGDCGHLRRLVLDPVANLLTHLVVVPHHDHDHHRGRLVPVGLIDPEADDLTLRCTQADFLALDAAQESEFLAPEAGAASYSAPALRWPYYALGAGGLGAIAISGSGVEPLRSAGVIVTHHSVPLGEVEVRRHQHVEASDGWVGKVRGLVVNPSDSRVTHLLLDEGHLFGHHDVAIPISAVATVSRQVQLSLAKEEVRALPAVSLAQAPHVPAPTCIGWMPSPWSVRL